MDSTQAMKRLTHGAYTVACLCPLAVELAPMWAMLDAVHEDLPGNRDYNTYVLGSIGEHNVVIATPATTGTCDIAVVATQLENDFPNIHIRLLVGIGGGCPGNDGKDDIRLGDVVVSEPLGTSGGVMQLDKGKHRTDMAFEPTGHLNKPPAFLTATVKKLRGRHMMMGNGIQRLLSQMLTQCPAMQEEYSCPGWEHDRLFETTYHHQSGGDCDLCDPRHSIPRSERHTGQIKIHYGPIGSSNAVIRDAIMRDSLRQKFGVICVEMEAAGLMDNFPCLVIRGVCDYADSHKNKKWQPYAASTAAAYAKELLLAASSHHTRQTGSSDTSLVTEGSENQTNLHPRYSNLPFNTTRDRPQILDRYDTTEQEVYQRLLSALTFDRIDARLLNISAALPQTCTWLFIHPTFREWYGRDKSEHEECILWMKGKPGSGKSTIMKNALNWAKKQDPRAIVISYFFNARAAGDLEKSTVGMYRSLVHQLVLAANLRTDFVATFGSKVQSVRADEWTIYELQDFMVTTIQNWKGPPLNIFIDALDEGEDQMDVRRMVAFLDDLTMRSVESGMLLRICLASRHYPHITIQRGLSLIVEDQQGHQADILKFVYTKLVTDTHSDMDHLQSQICQKSAGVFLWVVLVVQLLNDEYDRGGHASDMLQLLEDIPEELDLLFARLLARSDVRIDETVLILQWVLLSPGALSPQSLYAGLMYCFPGYRTDRAKLDDLDSLDRYILHCSRGLIEKTKSDPPSLQFIHESVRDFVLKRDGLSHLQSGLLGNWRAGSHEQLKTACLRCLEEISKNRQERVARNKSKSGITDSNSRIGLLPPSLHGVQGSKSRFLQYIVLNMFRHSNAADEWGISQVDFVRRFCTKDSPLLWTWVNLANTQRGFNAYGYNTTVEPLYIFAEHGHANLVDILLRNQVDLKFANKMEKFGSALQVACVNQHEAIARRLILAGANVNAQGGEYHTALQAAAFYCSESLVSLLLEKGAKVNTRGGAYGSALQAATRRASARIVSRLVEAGADVNVSGGHYGTPLLYAIYNKNEDIVRCLAEGGADTNASGRFGSALKMASRIGRDGEGMVRILLENGARPLSTKQVTPIKQVAPVRLPRSSSSPLSPPTSSKTRTTGLVDRSKKGPARPRDKLSPAPP